MSKLGIKSTREAEEWCEGAASSTYIGSWYRGKVPEYSTAVEFLKFAPREDAIHCLEAAGYPPPKDWFTADPAAGMELYLRNSGISESSIKRIMEIARREIDEDRKRSEQDDAARK